jgi:peptidoglycan-N-acetylglucosamine deacetylase
MPRRRITRAGLAWHAAELHSRVLNATARVQRHVGPGAVALTFDDGPHPGSTDRILDVLGELEVRATFFCVGNNVRAYPDLVRRMQNEGHAIGSHSHTHPYPAETALRSLARDYRQGREALARVVGKQISLFRPPHGHLDWASAGVIRQLGLVPWLWSVDPEDWRPCATREHIAAVGAGAMSGDVVLLHDWIEQPWSPEALDRSATIGAVADIVAQIRSRGLVLERLPL